MEIFYVVIIILGLVAYWGGTYLLKRKLVNDITKAMEQDDYERYQKLIFSKRAMLLLNPNLLSLLRSNHFLLMNNMEEAEKYLKMVIPKKLDLGYMINYYQTRINLTILKKDLAEYEKTIAELKELENDSNRETIQSLIKQFEINKKLSLEYDRTVIEDLKKDVEIAQGRNKGIANISLAKAYYLDKNSKDAVVALKKAKDLLAGTPYEQMIKEAIKNPEILVDEI